MALLSKKDQADDGESAASAKGVASRLKALEERGFTGAVEVGVKGSSAQAQIYLYEGGIYAVNLEGYGPVLMDRLATEGIVDRARWGELATIFGPHRSHPRVGPTAVEQEWMTLDELVNLHQEYLIAMLGAVLAVSKARVDRETNATTGAFCSLPQDLPRLLRLVQGRQQRTAGAWAAIEARCEPAELVLRRGRASVPSNLDHDEFRALLGAVDGERGLDEIAASLGLTRGDAIRAASLLVLAGSLEVDHEKRAVPPTDRLLVPEAWGVTISERTEPELPAPVLRSVPVGVVASGRGDGPPAWLLREPAPVPVAEPVPVPVPVPVPEAYVEPEAQPEAQVEPVPVPEAYVEPEPEAESFAEPEAEPLAEPEAPSEAHVEPEPEPEAYVAPEVYVEPEPEPEPEPFSASESFAEPEANTEPVPVVEPVPEPAPAPEAAPEPVPADVAVPAAIGDGDALLARHRRLQEATDQALLLEQLLSESLAVEREALERSAVIRERLRETLAQVASLTSPEAIAAAERREEER